MIHLRVMHKCIKIHYFFYVYYLDQTHTKSSPVPELHGDENTYGAHIQRHKHVTDREIPLARH